MADETLVCGPYTFGDEEARDGNVPSIAEQIQNNAQLKETVLNELKEKEFSTKIGRF